MCAHNAHMVVKGQLLRADSLLPLWGSWGFNTGYQTSQQVPVSADHLTILRNAASWWEPQTPNSTNWRKQQKCESQHSGFSTVLGHSSSSYMDHKKLVMELKQYPIDRTTQGAAPSQTGNQTNREFNSGTYIRSYKIKTDKKLPKGNERISNLERRI